MADATYHVVVWAEMPHYVCLLCSADGMTIEAVREHLSTIHQADAIPTVGMAHLLQMAGHTVPDDPA